MRALEVLEGIGDDGLGQWEERGVKAYHIRRRLTPAEQEAIGQACDLRGTREAQERLSAAWRYLPTFMRSAASTEIERKQD